MTLAEQAWTVIEEAFAGNATLSQLTVMRENRRTTPEAIEAAMKSGYSLVLCTPSYARDGDQRIRVNVPIELAVNMELNDAEGGAGLDPEAIAEEIWTVLEGYYSNSYQWITPLSPQGMDPQGGDDGILVYVVNVETTAGIKRIEP